MGEIYSLIKSEWCMVSVFGVSGWCLDVIGRCLKMSEANFFYQIFLMKFFRIKSPKGILFLKI